MILLSGYEEQTDMSAVDAFVDVDENSPFFSPSAGGVPGCVALEYMAQTMALATGLERLRAGKPPQVGFVLGSRRLEVRIPFFRAGERYRIRAICTYSDEEFGSFDCRVTDGTGEIVASGTVTAFQPGDDFTAEKLKEYT